jgi:cytochrome c-type biogenesis protein CcmH
VRRVRVLCVAAVLALLATTTAAAQDAVAGDPAGDRMRADSIRADSILEVRTRAVAAELRCAVCQGISIEESPSALAREMRDLVKEQLRAGSTPAEVKEYFVAAYGEWILLSPKPRGLNLVLYIAPVLLLLGGIVGIVILVRRWTAAVPPAPPEGPPPAPPAD